MAVAVSLNIDLDTGAQAMATEDGSVHVVFNGKIDDFAELRRELIAHGRRLRSNNDTGVIVHLYAQMGTDCAKRLDGMFAFALWDERQHWLLLARQPVGIAPLYVATTATPADDRSDADEKFVRTPDAFHPVEDGIRA